MTLSNPLKLRQFIASALFLCEVGISRHLLTVVPTICAAQFHSPPVKPVGCYYSGQVLAYACHVPVCCLLRRVESTQSFAGDRQPAHAQRNSSTHIPQSVRRDSRIRRISKEIHPAVFCRWRNGFVRSTSTRQKVRSSAVLFTLLLSAVSFV